MTNETKKPELTLENKLSPEVLKALGKKPEGELLNDAAGLLLNKLPDHMTELFDTVCKDYSLPRWQLVCGLLLEVYMQGNLTAFTRDPDWEHEGRAVAPVCGTCQKPFTPKRLGQKYCCVDCGTRAEIKAGTLKPGVFTPIVHIEPGFENDVLHPVGITARPGVAGNPAPGSPSGGAGWGAEAV